MRVTYMISLNHGRPAPSTTDLHAYTFSRKPRYPAQTLTFPTYPSRKFGLEAVGQLTASIAHEVNQPIAATVTNAQAALRWLDRPTPDLDEAKQALGRIVRDGTRAGAVVQRIRNLIKKAPTREEGFDISAAVRDVIELSRAEAVKSGVSVETELAEALPVIRVDRVELQQVILNLILNAVEAMSGSEGSRKLRITTGKTESGDIL